MFSLDPKEQSSYNNESTALGPVSPKSNPSVLHMPPAGPPERKIGRNSPVNAAMASMEKSQLMAKAKSYEKTTSEVPNALQVVGIPAYSVNYFPAYRKRFNF